MRKSLPSVAYGDSSPAKGREPPGKEVIKVPRSKCYIEPATQADLIKEIKREYGAYLTRGQVCEYLGVSRNSPIVNGIPGYRLTPGRIKYRAADIAAFMVQRRTYGDQV